MARRMADCRRWPSGSNCSLVIVGEEEEVIRPACEHAVSVHGPPAYASASGDRRADDAEPVAGSELEPARDVRT